MAVVAKILGESNAAMDPFKACDGSPRYRLILRLRRPQDRKGPTDCSAVIGRYTVICRSPSPVLIDQDSARSFQG